MRLTTCDQPRLAELVAVSVERLGHAVAVATDDRGPAVDGATVARRNVASGNTPSAGPSSQEAGDRRPVSTTSGGRWPALTIAIVARARYRARRYTSVAKRAASVTLHSARLTSRDDIGRRAAPHGVRWFRAALAGSTRRGPPACPCPRHRRAPGRLRRVVDRLADEKVAADTARRQRDAAASKPAIAGSARCWQHAPVPRRPRPDRARDRIALDSRSRTRASVPDSRAAVIGLTQIVRGVDRERVERVAIEGRRKHDEGTRLGQRRGQRPCPTLPASRCRETRRRDARRQSTSRASTASPASPTTSTSPASASSCRRRARAGGSSSTMNARRIIAAPAGVGPSSSRMSGMRDPRDGLLACR